MVGIIGFRVFGASQNANVTPITVGDCVKVSETSESNKVKAIPCVPSTEPGKVTVRLERRSLQLDGSDCTQGAMSLRSTGVRYCVVAVV
jgi:hypothetical protein